VNVLAIDQGTSSMKALVIDPGGRVLGEGQAPVSPRASADGTVLQDPLELERSVLAAGRAALAAAGGEVGTIGLGNQGETVLRWDRDSGEPLGPAISWQDRRAAAITRELAGGQWSANACAIFGLEVGALPAIVGNAQIVGETDAFGAALPVSGLIVDQQAALFAQSCFAPGEAKCTYGTGAFILANARPAALHSTSRLAACVAWDLAGATTYCLDGQTYTAGAAISWLREIGLLGDASRLDATSPPGPPPPAGPLFVAAAGGPWRALLGAGGSRWLGWPVAGDGRR
jgi:glycerol kinase